MYKTGTAPVIETCGRNLPTDGAPMALIMRAAQGEHLVLVANNLVVTSSRHAPMLHEHAQKSGYAVVDLSDDPSIRWS